MRILLIEDNERLSELVSQVLTADGFAVDIAFNLSEAKELLEMITYDLILLDLSLPDGDGLELIKNRSNKKTQTPILVVTARTGLDDRINGLNLGADDYLVKPFATEELIARCRALLRRPGAVLGNVLTAGNLSFNSSNREVIVNGKTLNISPREMALLEHLMRHIGQVVTRESLEISLYSMDKEVTPNAIEASVSRLRRWLKNSAVDLNLYTSHGIGYALMTHESK
jgi:DNA-binding response OmpR family regulator